MKNARTRARRTRTARTPTLPTPRPETPRPPDGLLALVLLAAAGCCSFEDRRLDPDRPEPVRAELELRILPGRATAASVERIKAGHIIAFSTREASSDGSATIGAAIGEYSHVGIAYTHFAGMLKVLSADSEQGVFTEGVERFIGEREAFVYSFPPGTINLDRLAEFAHRAQFLGALDYDWSAALLGLNSNLTPNALVDVGDEYTCATVVAAALHFSGLSLDRAYCPCQFVAPGDIIFSDARPNRNFITPLRR